MTAKKLFFCLCANHLHKPHFKAKILFNFVPATEASEDYYRSLKTKEKLRSCHL